MSVVIRLLAAATFIADMALMPMALEALVLKVVVSDALSAAEAAPELADALDAAELSADEAVDAAD